MRRVSIKGFVLGGVVDIVATNIFAIPVVVVALTFAFSHGVPTNANASQLLLSSPGVTAAMMILGALASVLGGYVAAWLAKHDELLNGALSAYLCVCFGLFGVAGHHDKLLLELVTLPLSPCLGALGGYLKLAQLRRVRRQPA